MQFIDIEDMAEYMGMLFIVGRDFPQDPPG
jgi:hypothetical protein